MLRRYLIPLIACLALFAAACSSSGDDDAEDQTTTTEATGGDDETTTTEGAGGDDQTTTTEATGGETTTTTEANSGGGGGGGGGNRQAYVDAMTASLMDGDSSLPISSGQAECVSESWVDIFDPDRLAAAGITPDDIRNDNDTGVEFADMGLSESEADDLIGTFGDCGIDLTQAIVDPIVEDGNLTPEDRACLENAFNEDFLRRLMVISITEGDEALEEDPELMGEMMGALFACPGAMGLSEGALGDMEG